MVQTRAEIPREFHGGKTAGNASLQAEPSIPRPVHVPAHDDGFARLNIHGAAGTSERLFADMAVEEHPSIDEPSVGRHHFPPVGILATPGVGAANRYRKAV